MWQIMRIKKKKSGFICVKQVCCITKTHQIHQIIFMLPHLSAIKYDFVSKTDAMNIWLNVSFPLITTKGYRCQKYIILWFYSFYTLSTHLLTVKTSTHTIYFNK